MQGAYLDDLHQLVDAGLSWEQRLPQEQLCHDAPHAPNVDRRRVVGRTENEFRGAVVPAARGVGHRNGTLMRATLV